MLRVGSRLIMKWLQILVVCIAGYIAISMLVNKSLESNDPSHNLVKQFIQGNSLLDVTVNNKQQKQHYDSDEKILHNRLYNDNEDDKIPDLPIDKIEIETEPDEGVHIKLDAEEQHQYDDTTDDNQNKSQNNDNNNVQKSLKNMPMYVDIAARHMWMMPDKQNELLTIQKCKEKVYDDPTTLPNVSVIISFHESEKLTHLLHTLHSIVKHSPSQVLKEIIMIADNSSKLEHQDILENYVTGVFSGLVKIHRSKEPLGLIRARQLGVELSTSDVVCSMDAHMEVQEGWLEPILQEIKKDRKTMVTPFLDWMKPQPDGSWVYEHGNSRYKTVWFWWNMFFTFMELPQEFKQTVDPTAPIVSPCSVGTIWAMDRKYFHEVGGFDLGMKFWGGENIDLPLRVFLFGGRHIQTPCSHAAHLEEQGQRNYRKGNMADTSVNYKRIVETWFTPEYKDVIYYYNPIWKQKEVGNLSDRLELRSKAVHNFTYYMKNFFPEMKAPGINTLAWGGVKNIGLENSDYVAKKDACVIIDFNTFLVKAKSCRYSVPHSAGIFWTTDGELRLAGHIIHPPHWSGAARGISQPSISNYMGVYGTERIPRFLHYENGLIQVFNKAYTNICLKVFMEDTRPRISSAVCNSTDAYQMWKFGNYTKEYKDFVTKQETFAKEGSIDFYSNLTRFIDSHIR